jgi:hypothetical protein
VHGTEPHQSAGIGLDVGQVHGHGFTVPAGGGTPTNGRVNGS